MESVPIRSISPGAQVLTGDRATGPLHLGHYAGSLHQRVRLQDLCAQTILVADLQGLTDNGYEPQKVAANVLNLVADYLSVGIDPEKTIICLQSAIPALPELTMYFANLVSIARLERNPTVKNEIGSRSFGNSVPAGFLMYPVSQAADIAAFRATLVPVGEDQLPMIELTNEVVRKVNKVAGRQVLLECRPLLGKVSRLPSTDGKSKMSKSAGNAILLSASESEISRAVKSMFTDPHHLKVEQPGRVEGNVVFTYLDAFHPDSEHVSKLKERYARGGLSDSATKAVLEDCLQELLRPIRERRKSYASDKAQLLDILKRGTEKARGQAEDVLKEVKHVFGMDFF